MSIQQRSFILEVDKKEESFNIQRYISLSSCVIFSYQIMAIFTFIFLSNSEK